MKFLKAKNENPYTILDMVERFCFTLLGSTMVYYSVACLTKEDHSYFYFLKIFFAFISIITLIVTILNYRDKNKNEPKK